MDLGSLGTLTVSDDFGTYRELAIGARTAFVLEDAIHEGDRREAYAFFRLLGYRFNHGDRSDARRILHWAYDFKDTEIESNRTLRALTVVARRFLAHRGLPFAFLERAYANIALYGDVQLAHDDGDVWTALYFANPEWDLDFGGELFMYGEDPSVAVAIQPRPGRLVVFDGMIPHRAGVPSKLCLDPRITVAIKLRRSRDDGATEER